MATVPALSEPILVANLPLPAAVAGDLEGHLRSHRFTPSERADIADNVKLRHHYAGHHVVATAGPRGLEIHAIDLDDANQIRECKQRLAAQGFRNIFSLYPIPLDSPGDQVLTLNPVS